MRHPPRVLLVLIAALGLVAPPLAAAQPPDSRPARVMLLGTFHFANPGKDLVKSDVIDVRRDEAQHYLEALSHRIAREFAPTHVLLEYPAEAAEAMAERYAAYRSGEFALPVDEVYQLGFRIAEAAGLDEVTGFDVREPGWAAEPMLAWAERHAPERRAAFDALAADYGERIDEEQRTLSLPELMLLENQPARLEENKGLYLITNDLGAGDGWSGADASASWWHRNFRMYANVQQAAQPGERVLVIAGSGHVAILADLLAADPTRVGEDVRPLLRE